MLGEPVLKAAVYDLEQAEQEAAAVELLTVILVGVDAVTESGNYRLDDTYTVRGALEVAELLTDHFLRALHHRLFERIWAWAGTYRAVELNIGVPPPMVAVDIRASLESLRYRWEHTSDWTGRQLGIAAHAELVRIHPFTDGNGRTTRLLLTWCSLPPSRPTSR
ncbi:Fic family protein [Terrabacter sp. C0L_2]|uniref:Fic family protein n=1 Tax=Terrabacter sp. C0L_2 TaxID=3108389 RepID=UPI002ED6A1EC|nr:Fic family protein [Terrabacter sp. C0L_2]